MMEPDQRLPNGARAVVPPGKVEAYLLNDLHTQNRGKARFFELAGYSLSQPERLERDLKTIARTGRVTGVVPTDDGMKYVVVGELSAPNRRNYLITTVWMIESEKTEPRLVTAYPNRK